MPPLSDLHVTPSAVSQRIKALEQRVGQVLVRREKPTVATPAGVPLLRLAAQTALLESEALADMGGGSSERTRVAIAVNADSMSTWFTAVLRRATGSPVRPSDRGPGPLGPVAARGRGDGGGHHRARSGARMSRDAARGHALRAGGQRGLSSSAICARGFHGRRRGLRAVAGLEPRRCATGHVDTQGVSPRRHTAGSLRADRGGVRVRGSGRVWAGACSRQVLPPRTWRTARSSGYPMCTSMCRCSGSAGSWTAR